MHGHMNFVKIIDLDVDKIRQTCTNPEGKIEEIHRYVASILPERKQENQKQ